MRVQQQLGPEAFQALLEQAQACASTARAALSVDGAGGLV